MSVKPFDRLPRRGWNLWRRLRAGLTLFGENVSPEIPNDLFIAHLSVYVFASQFCTGRRVLDLGSGAGYGSDYLLRHGAVAAVGIDVDPRNVRYARRRYRSDAVEFLHGDAEKLDESLGRFGLIVASNVLEHLHDVRPAFDSLQKMLEPGGRMVVAVPPIFDEVSLRENEAIPYHRSNLMIGQWLELLDARFGSVECYRLDVRTGVQPDFTSPFPSRLSPKVHLRSHSARCACRAADHLGRVRRPVKRIGRRRFSSLKMTHAGSAPSERVRSPVIVERSSQSPVPRDARVRRL